MSSKQPFGGKESTKRRRPGQLFELSRQHYCVVRNFDIYVNTYENAVAATAAEAAAVAPRRELNRERTRLNLALAAFELAKSGGSAAVRVPQIAAAVGVSPRTFNNYFASKDQAIAWLAGRHAASMAAPLRRAQRTAPW